MKRCWMGFWLLVALLAGSSAVTVVMDDIHAPAAAELEQAAADSLEGNWESAVSLGSSARKRWDRWEHLRACFADHTPLEEIDAGFAELSAYAQAGEAVPYAAACRHLAQQIRAVGEAHGVGWWNVL